MTEPPLRRIPVIGPASDRGPRDRYYVELTWPQVEALQYAASTILARSAPVPNRNALRHALAALKRLRYRPTRAQREQTIR